MLIKQKATPYTKLIREWLSYPHARSPLQKYFPPARPLRLRALSLSSPSSLPPSRAPHLSLTTSAYGPHSYFHFFLSFHLAYLTLLLSFALLLTPLSILLSLELAVFETLRTSVSVFNDVVPEQ